MKKIRVLIVEDSAVVRMLLQHIIGEDARLEVAAVAGSGEEALQILERLTPDVIALDLRLPGIDGMETTRRIMSGAPIPIVVVAGNSPLKEWEATSMEAMRSGALAVLEKPAGTTNAEYKMLAERLCTQLVIMSQVRLVRQYSSRKPRTAHLPLPSSIPPGGVYQILGIACSTGGPAALVQLLGGLGEAFPLPILLVQHMTASFLPDFATWLQSVCPFSVVIVQGGEIPAVRTVYLAPAERHLCFVNGRLRLDSTEPVCSQRPSGTVLLQSMARDLGVRALGVLLTGMGEDGAAGLDAIRRAGGYTIAQDEASCAVYGMPAAAVALGAVCESLPLTAIAPRVLDLAWAGKEMN
jgi:two-component system chemotaxis response regulator CheB